MALKLSLLAWLVHGSEDDAMLQASRASGLVHGSEYDAVLQASRAGHTSSSCTEEHAKKTGKLLAGEAVAQGTEQAVELGMKSMWKAAGPAGAFGGSLAGTLFADKFVEDPYENRFKALDKAVDCLDKKVAQNTQDIARLKVEVQDLRTLIGLTNNVAQVIADAIAELAFITAKGTFCAQCLSHHAFGLPAPEEGGGFSCHDLDYCKVAEFQAAINAKTSRKILHLLGTGLNRLQKIWMEVPAPYEKPTDLFTASSSFTKTLGWFDIYQTNTCPVHKDAEFVVALVKALPAFFTAALLSTQPVKSWMNALILTECADNGSCESSLTNRVEVFYKHILHDPLGDSALQRVTSSPCKDFPLPLELIFTRNKALERWTKGYECRSCSRVIISTDLHEYVKGVQPRWVHAGDLVEAENLGGRCAGKEITDNFETLLTIQKRIHSEAPWQTEMDPNFLKAYGDKVRRRRAPPTPAPTPKRKHRPSKGGRYRRGKR